MFCRLFLLLSLFADHAYAQSHEKFIKSLKAQGADTILCFSIETIRGLPKIIDSIYSCYSADYLLWKLNGKTWLQKFSDCFDLPFIIKASDGGREYYYTASVSHPAIYHMSIYLKDTTIAWEVNYANIKKDYSIQNDKGELVQYFENVNAGWNTSTALWKLMELAEIQISQPEKRRQFSYKGPSK